MSDNSIIFLDLNKFTVTHCDVENNTGGCYSKSKHKTLKSAIIKAQKIQNTQSPEYGTYFLSKLK